MTKRLLSTALAAACAVGLSAQTGYDVFVEGVFPARVVIDEGDRSGRYRYGSAAEASLALRGSCTAGHCVFVAVDSALALHFTHDGDTLAGHLRLGDGRELPLGGRRRYDLSAPLLTGCADGAWLRAFASVDDAYALVLARHPGGRTRGTLYVRATDESLAANGTVVGGRFALELAGPGGALAGSIAGDDIAADTLLGALSLLGTEGSDTGAAVALALDEALDLGCLQADGRRGLVYPVAGDAGADLDLRRRVRLWWRALEPAAGVAPAEGSAAVASGWFEPVRLDANYLSGWQHLRLPDGRTESHAVTVDRERGRLLRGSMSLAGSRREREARRTAARRRAIVAHPLSADEAFRTWADTQVLAEFAVARDGLAFGGEHHPVYGQLRWTEPWESLEAGHGLVDLLPDWLRGWIGGVPAERGEE